MASGDVRGQLSDCGDGEQLSTRPQGAGTGSSGMVAGTGSSGSGHGRRDGDGVCGGVIDGWSQHVIGGAEGRERASHARQTDVTMFLSQGTGLGEQGVRDRSRQDDGPTLECRTKKCLRFVLFSCERY